MEPKALLETVATRYARYLRTTFFIRDPDLRQSFRIALDRHPLAKGPYLEMTPRFRAGLTLRQLLQELFPTEVWEEGFFQALNADRPLYWHQEAAIRRLLGGRNAVVATGTGSGKTEAFLLPILIELYRAFHREQREGRRRAPGVRALVLYPMNALVADQRERLGTIAQALKTAKTAFRFTFGQYIGATPESEADAFREPYPLFPGELGTRQAMQASPPDILITNYSMLEYLLIRPDDSPLFDNGHSREWRFLILDEAHQYRGAKGMEMAMLIRRLKDRLRLGGRNEPFTCVATSASLGVSDSASQTAIAEFAGTLFGEPFAASDVILGATEPVAFGGEALPPPDCYRGYLEAWQRGALDPAELFERLRSDRRVAQLASRLAVGPVPMDEAARDLFPECPPEDAAAHLDELVRTAVTARPREDQLPLLPLRYHFFLRSLEGLRITFRPKAAVHLVGLEPAEARMGKSFDLGLCRHCGQHYLLGRWVDGRLEPPIRDPGHWDYRPTYFRPLTPVLSRKEAAFFRAQWDDDEEDTAQSSPSFALCVECGMVEKGSPPPCQHAYVLWVSEVTPEDAGQLRCEWCGNQGRDVIAEVTHGADGPHTVIATALFEHLPSDRRKILAFADSRQRAAFFAWYFGDSHDTIVRRKLLLQVVHDQMDRYQEVDLTTAAEAYAQTLKAKGIADPSDSWGTRLSRAWLEVLQEVLGEDRAVSLEATGLLYGRVRRPDWWDPTPLSHRWEIPPAEITEAAQWIWQTMIEDGAVELPQDAGEWERLRLNRPQAVAVLGLGSRKRVKVLDGLRSKRVDVLARWLAPHVGAQHATQCREQAQQFIREAVDYTIFAQEAEPTPAHLLVTVHNPAGYRVNLRWWRFFAPGPVLRRCQVCHRITTWHLGTVCTSYRCLGPVESLAATDFDAEGHHYRELYREPFQGMLRVEEHTAQIERRQALAYQNDFKRGYIHVLSSSTTFELGVDLGDLDVVFLRNVPPETFNYAQRVGRAGRRPGYPGIAVTYCGRTPHDLYHFDHPERLIAGGGMLPIIRIENERLVLRHWMAVVLSLYFRHPDNRQRFGTVEHFFGGMQRPNILMSLQAFVDQQRATLDPLLDRLIPAPVLERVRDRWENKVLGEESPLALAVAETVADWQQAKDFEEQSRDARDYSAAQWAKQRAQQIAGQDVLGFLSRRVIIPKYGFPVDVVELTLAGSAKAAQGVLLQRDLSVAIAEFAPTGQVVANKLVWTSDAVKRVPDREWPRYRYRRCLRHGILERYPTPGDDFRGAPCCGEMYEGEYIEPIFGFTSYKDGRPPRGRVDRLFTTRPFWVGDDNWGSSALVLTREEDPATAVVRVYNVRPGRIVVLSEGKEGKGFYICPVCGCGALTPIKRGHPLLRGGRTCQGSALKPVALGHEFMTDVLRLDFPTRLGGSMALAYGVAYALEFSAAELLDVPASDLNALGFAVDPVSILLYDNVPGGAGLVSQLARPQVLRQCLAQAVERLSGRCGCTPTESCYGCLRNYGNQFLHHELQRGPVHEFLAELNALRLIAL